MLSSLKVLRPVIPISKSGSCSSRRGKELGDAGRSGAKVKDEEISNIQNRESCRGYKIIDDSEVRKGVRKKSQGGDRRIDGFRRKASRFYQLRPVRRRRDFAGQSC